MQVRKVDTHLEKIENIFLPDDEINGDVNPGDGGKRPADQSPGRRGGDGQPIMRLKIRRRGDHRHIHGERRGKVGGGGDEHARAGGG